MLNKHTIVTTCIAVTLFTAGLLARDLAQTEPKGPAAAQDGIAVYFSPKGGCEEAIVERINAAKKTIDLQAYAFTNSNITKAIIRAKDRGVKIRAVLDKSNQTEKYSSATPLANAGIPVTIDSEHEIAHSKIMLIDGSTIITGSFNFTKAAEVDNAENLLIIDNKKLLVAAYAKNFTEHAKHSKPYEQPAK